MLADSESALTNANVEATLHALLPRIRRDAAHREIKFDGITADLFRTFDDIRRTRSALGRVQWWPRGNSFSIENDENILNKATYVETVKIYSLGESALVKAKRLSIIERREIFTLVVRAKERAFQEAEALFPADVTKLTTLQLRTYDLTKARKDNAAEFEHLHKKYRAEIRNKFNATEAQLNAIKKEGVERDWPLLPR